VSDSATWLAAVVPALTLAGAGGALLRTRSRVSGLFMLAAGVGVAGAVATRFMVGSSAGSQVVLASIMLPGAMAVLAFPRADTTHPLEYCAWISVVGAGSVALLSSAASAEIAMANLTLLALIGVLWWRFERSDEQDRMAILWFSVGATISGGALPLLSSLFGQPGRTVGILTLSLVGPVMFIGIRRPHVVDVRGLVVQVVVFTVVGLTYVSLFVAAVAVLDIAGVEDPGLSELAVIGLLVAATFHPLRVILRGIIDEVLFGERPDPLVAATRVADHVGDDPALALRAIREALVLPFARLTESGKELAVSGTAVTHTRRLSLALGGDTFGEIEVGLRPGDLTLSAADEHVLRIVAPLLAQTLRARNLARELQDSRGAAITAIEEERSRLRRDLHDGLGPTLSGIALTADAARNTMRRDPDGADELLRRLRSDAAAAVGDVRRLVYDMRPPALDQLGLVPAIQQQLSSTRTPCGTSMRIEVDAPAELPPLPAAVEVACYRITTEAVTNAARHSGSDRASVRIEMKDGDLIVDISDRGTTPGPWIAGVGLSSMRERASELGGTLHIEHAADGSTVRARLPIP
jgi:signal transduction histidine kinase